MAGWTYVRGTNLCRGDMSKKAVFFDISRKHVEGANMWASVAEPIFFTGVRATFCDAIPESRQYKHVRQKLR